MKNYTGNVINNNNKIFNHGMKPVSMMHARIDKMHVHDIFF